MIGSRFWWVALVVALANCRCSRDGSRSEPNPMPPPGAGASGGSSEASAAGAARPARGDADSGLALARTDRDAGGAGAVQFPADWCVRLGGMNGLPAVIRITNAYNAAVSMDCVTAGLTSPTALSDEQYDEWRSYLQNYTF